MRLSIFAAALLLATPALAQQPAGNADNGKKLFEKVGCWQCHGLVGQGSLLSGPRISRTALPLDAFTQQLRSPSNDMPPYEAAVLPEAGVADIYAYIKAMPAPPDPKSLPLLTGMGAR